MLNHITIMGRLTAAHELRRTNSGVPVTSFTIACERDHKPENGEREVDFVDIVCWRSTAEFATKYLGKGRMVVVSGQLQIRNWTDKNGNSRRTAEIVAENVYFADSRPEGQSTARLAHNPAVAAAQPSAYTGPADYGLIDGEDAVLPF